MFEIRYANINDINSIMEVIKDAKDLFKSQGSDQWQDLDGYPNEQVFIEDLSKNVLLVATLDEKIVGVCTISYNMEECYKKIDDGLWLNDLDYAVIHRLAIRKEFYHTGIAKALMKRAEVIVYNYGLRDIRVDTHIMNKSMQGLLSYLGYSYCGKIYLLRKDVLDKMRLAYHKTLS